MGVGDIPLPPPRLDTGTLRGRLTGWGPGEELTRRIYAAILREESATGDRLADAALVVLRAGLGTDTAAKVCEVLLREGIG
jgi:hypothetical protein